MYITFSLIHTAKSVAINLWNMCIIHSIDAMQKLRKHFDWKSFSCSLYNIPSAKLFVSIQNYDYSCGARSFKLIVLYTFISMLMCICDLEFNSMLKIVIIKPEASYDFGGSGREMELYLSIDLNVCAKN